MKMYTYSEELRAKARYWMRRGNTPKARHFYMRANWVRQRELEHSASQAPRVVSIA